jgi:FAD-dependent oxidoreductase domain-containing protein 1
MSNNYDVIFIGGGVMSAATAYCLLLDQPKTKVVIIEKDPTYRKAASPLALGGVRQQFSTRVNIRMSRQSVDVYENFGEIMESGSGKPQIDFRQGGYLFLISEKKWPTALEIANLQKEEGVEIELLTPDDIYKMIPELDIGGIVGGTICRRDGILDPQQVMQGYIKKVKEMGADFVYDEVIGVEKEYERALGVVLKSGEKYFGNAVVNSAGPWAGLIGKMAGVDVPVKPLPHDIYVCKIQPDIRIGRSYTTLPTDTWWFKEQPDGDTILTGKTKLDFDFLFDYIPERDFFFDEVWPDLAGKLDCFDRIKLIKAWRGCYDYNFHDYNAIIGEHPELKSFYLITGFSGHGLMQAPAAGRGLAELIIYGKYKTLDLSDVNPGRFADGKLVIERAVI